MRIRTLHATWCADTTLIINQWKPLYSVELCPLVFFSLSCRARPYLNESFFFILYFILLSPQFVAVYHSQNCHWHRLLNTNALINRHLTKKTETRAGVPRMRDSKLTLRRIRIQYDTIPRYSTTLVADLNHLWLIDSASQLSKRRYIHTPVSSISVQHSAPQHRHLAAAPRVW